MHIYVHKRINLPIYRSDFWAGQNNMSVAAVCVFLLFFGWRGGLLSTLLKTSIFASSSNDHNGFYHVQPTRHGNLFCEVMFLDLNLYDFLQLRREIGKYFVYTLFIIFLSFLKNVFCLHQSFDPKKLERFKFYLIFKCIL